MQVFKGGTEQHGYSSDRFSHWLKKKCLCVQPPGTDVTLAVEGGDLSPCQLLYSGVAIQGVRRVRTGKRASSHGMPLRVGRQARKQSAVLALPSIPVNMNAWGKLRINPSGH